MIQLDYGDIDTYRLFKVLKKGKAKSPVILHALSNMENHAKNKGVTA